jgi:2-hydroxychromene-2-carboxylate isomerase
MAPTVARLFFDFTDPLSYLVERTLAELEHEDPLADRIGFELRPPPEPITAATDPLWAPRWEVARRVSGALPAAPPPLVPWTRKAHELHLWAAARESAVEVRRALFEAFFQEGRDIGRVDELVRIAVAAGLDGTAAKATLDVDRHEQDVMEVRRDAARCGVVELPALVFGGRVVQGFHNLTDLSTLLGGSPPGGR